MRSRRRIASAVLVLVPAFVPAVVHAHPGHGSADAHSALHWLVDHGALVGFFVLVCAGAGFVRAVVGRGRADR